MAGGGLVVVSLKPFPLLLQGQGQEALIVLPVRLLGGLRQL
jgi:hypothetical protein